MKKFMNASSVLVLGTCCYLEAMSPPDTVFYSNSGQQLELRIQALKKAGGSEEEVKSFTEHWTSQRAKNEKRWIGPVGFGGSCFTNESILRDFRNDLRLIDMRIRELSAENQNHEDTSLVTGNSNQSEERFLDQEERPFEQSINSEDSEIEEINENQVATENSQIEEPSEIENQEEELLDTEPTPNNECQENLIFGNIINQNNDCNFTASSEYDRNHSVSNAFSSEGVWASTDDGEQWVQVEFPNAVVCDSARITSRGDEHGFFIHQAPRDFKIVGSNDENNWNVLYEASDIDWEDRNGETQTFLFDNSSHYKFYRLVMTESNEPSNKQQRNYSFKLFELGQSRQELESIDSQPDDRQDEDNQSQIDEQQNVDTADLSQEEIIASIETEMMESNENFQAQENEQQNVDMENPSQEEIVESPETEVAETN